MIDPDAPWEAALMAALFEQPPNLGSAVQRAQVPESPQALVDAMWDDSPLLIDLWADRVVNYGTSIIPFLVDGFGVVAQFERARDREWYSNHIILALTRPGDARDPGAPTDL